MQYQSEGAEKQIKIGNKLDGESRVMWRVPLEGAGKWADSTEK